MTSIRNRQISQVKQMLNFNQPIPKRAVTEPQWKILVLDQRGQEVISPLLSVKELRDLGVTLFLQLHQRRDEIPDAPAVYLVEPNEENMKRIAKDWSTSFYEAYYINSLSTLSRPLLEQLASAAIENNCINEVHKVFDQYLNFVTLNDDLFELYPASRSPINFYALNQPGLQDSVLFPLLDIIVDGLFSLCVSLETVPVIYSPRDSAAELVAQRLDKRLRENLKDTRNNLFVSDSFPSGQMSFQRPALVLLDRTVDLASMLHHTWTYASMLHDVMHMSMNKIETTEPPEPNKVPKKKSYDLAPNDPFWMNQKANPFPNVAESIQEALDNYKVEEEQIRNLKAQMGLDPTMEMASTSTFQTANELQSAVTNLPELIRKKKVLDMHTNLATSLLDVIKSRKLDEYFELEEKLMSKQSLDRSLIDIIASTQFGSTNDKLRLFLVHLLCGTELSSAELEQYVGALRQAGADTAAVNFIKKWRMFSSSGQAQTSSHYGGSIRSVTMFSNLMTQGSKLMMDGVKNLVMKQHKMPAARVVESILEQRHSALTESYRVFDPRQLKEGGTAAQQKQAFTSAIVFMVGGGSYVEYDNLVALGKNLGKQIFYGATELSHPEDFLSQLSRLGQES